MPANSENIITNQVHTGDSSIQTVTGDKYKGDGYYGRSDGLHTVQYNVDGFIGTISMQATLAIDPGASDWFSISSTSHVSADTDSNTATGSFIYNFTGNYVWVRAVITDWTDGTIQSVVLNH